MEINLENKIANPEESVYTDVLNKHYNGERNAKTQKY